MKLASVTLALLAAVVLAACGSSSSSSGSDGGGALTADVRAKVQRCLDSTRTQIFNKGPKGETALPASEMTLTDAEMRRIAAMRKTAAVAWHVMGSDYSVAQIAGVKDTFAKMGIRVLTVTDAEFKADKQVSDIETILARRPDFLISLPVDADAEADVYQRAASSGVRLVFAINAPRVMQHGKDYITVVGSDDYGTGLINACQMVQFMGGKGKIGLDFHEANYYATRQRYEAVRATLRQFPDIEIVDAKGVTGPDFTGQAAAVANSMITKTSDLKGIWTVWDTHAEGVLAAARELGKSPSDFSITTIDLGKAVAIDMAQGGMVKGVGGSRPYDQGVTEALAIGASLLGKRVGAYYAWNATPVTRDNVVQEWENIYRQPAPKEIRDAVGN